MGFCVIGSLLPMYAIHMVNEILFVEVPIGTLHISILLLVQSQENNPLIVY